MNIEQERRELDRQWHELEREKKEFENRIKFEEQRMEREQQLFNMKVKILEEELIKLASDKKEVEMKKAFYEQLAMREEQYRHSLEDSAAIRGDVFFRGVGNKKALKKRYKELIKIYHPDNVDGDNSTALAIKEEYDALREMYG